MTSSIDFYPCHNPPRSALKHGFRNGHEGSLAVRWCVGSLHGRDIQAKTKLSDGIVNYQVSPREQSTCSLPTEGCCVNSLETYARPKTLLCRFKRDKCVPCAGIAVDAPSQPFVASNDRSRQTANCQKKREYQQSSESPAYSLQTHSDNSLIRSRNHGVHPSERTSAQSSPTGGDHLNAATA